MRIRFSSKVDLVSGEYISEISWHESKNDISSRRKYHGEIIEEIEKVVGDTRHINYYHLHNKTKTLICSSLKREYDKPLLGHLSSSESLLFDDGKGNIKIQYYPRYTFE